METCFNPQEQQSLAKLNLLGIDDDHQIDQEKIDDEENNQWGQSVQIHTLLRDKLSQRYKLKRQSQGESRIKSTTRKEIHRKMPLYCDKQTLKQLLKKLDSKEIKTSMESTLKNSRLSENARFPFKTNHKYDNYSNRITLQHQLSQNRSLRKPLQQSIQNGQNNFISKKIDFKSGKKIHQIDEKDIMSIENAILEPHHNEFGRKRQSFTQCKKLRNFQKNVKTYNQNKENEVYAFMQNPINLFKGQQIMKNDKLISNTPAVKGSLMQRQDMNKKTFQILQQINRTKSISNVKKLVSQSLRLKKSQMAPYSHILKDRNNHMEQQIRPKTKGFFKDSTESLWVKLQIRR